MSPSPSPPLAFVVDGLLPQGGEEELLDPQDGVLADLGWHTRGLVVQHLPPLPPSQPRLAQPPHHTVQTTATITPTRSVNNTPRRNHQAPDHPLIETESRPPLRLTRASALFYIALCERCLSRTDVYTLCVADTEGESDGDGKGGSGWWREIPVESVG